MAAKHSQTRDNAQTTDKFVKTKEKKEEKRRGEERLFSEREIPKRIVAELIMFRVTRSNRRAGETVLYVEMDTRDCVVENGRRLV